MKKLPLEILTAILLDAWDQRWLRHPVASRSCEDWDHAEFRREELSTVCKQWYLTFQQPVFWTPIGPRKGLSELTALMEKSKKHPLDICYDDQKKEGKEEEDQEEEDKEALAKLKSEKARWRSLHLLWDGHARLLAGEDPLPRLRELAMLGIYKVVALPNAPKLEHLSIQTSQLEWNSNRWAQLEQLRSLELRMSMDAESKLPNSILKAMRSFKRLESLALKICGREDTVHVVPVVSSTETVFLDQLQDIALSSNVRGCILGLLNGINAPHVNRADVESSYDPPTVLDDACTSVCQAEAKATMKFVTKSSLPSQCGFLLVVWRPRSLGLEGYPDRCDCSSVPLGRRAPWTSHLGHCTFSIKLCLAEVQQRKGLTEEFFCHFQGSILLRPKESEISRPEMWQLPNIVHVDLRDIDLNVLRTVAQLAPESTVFVTDRKNQRRVLHEVCRETKGLRSRVFHRSVQSTFAYKKE